MLRMTLRVAYRRTVRSLLVNPPSLKTGSWNRLVVTIGTTIPVSPSASRNSLMIRSRSWAVLPGGIKSSSWKVIPYAPISASRLTASTVARAGRVASPNRSRACQPTVQSPKLNLSSRVGLRSISSRVSADAITTPPLRALCGGYTHEPDAMNLTSRLRKVSEVPKDRDQNMKARACLSRVLCASTYPNFRKETFQAAHLFRLRNRKEGARLVIPLTLLRSPVGHPAEPVEADLAALGGKPMPVGAVSSRFRSAC